MEERSRKSKSQRDGVRGELNWPLLALRMDGVKECRQPIEAGKIMKRFSPRTVRKKAALSEP